MWPKATGIYNCSNQAEHPEGSELFLPGASQGPVLKTGVCWQCAEFEQPLPAGLTLFCPTSYAEMRGVQGHPTFVHQYSLHQCFLEDPKSFSKWFWKCKVASLQVDPLERGMKISGFSFLCFFFNYHLKFTKIKLTFSIIFKCTFQ